MSLSVRSEKERMRTIWMARAAKNWRALKLSRTIIFAHQPKTNSETEKLLLSRLKGQRSVSDNFLSGLWEPSSSTFIDYGCQVISMMNIYCNRFEVRHTFCLFYALFSAHWRFLLFQKSQVFHDNQSQSTPVVVAIFLARVLRRLVVEDACFKMRITLGAVLIRSLACTKCIPGRLRSGSGVALN